MIVWEQRFIVEIDASSIIQMLNSPDPIPISQMNRGIAYLHFFDAEFKDVPGVKHTMPDALSRVARDDEDSMLDDQLSLKSVHITLVANQKQELGLVKVYLLEGLYAGLWQEVGRCLEDASYPEVAD